MVGYITEAAVDHRSFEGRSYWLSTPTAEAGADDRSDVVLPISMWCWLWCWLFDCSCNTLSRPAFPPLLWQSTSSTPTTTNTWHADGGRGAVIVREGVGVWCVEQRDQPTMNEIVHQISSNSCLLFRCVLLAGVPCARIVYCMYMYCVS
jgi:hypothetical protein